MSPTHVLLLVDNMQGGGGQLIRVLEFCLLFKGHVICDNTFQNASLKHCMTQEGATLFIRLPPLYCPYMLSSDSFILFLKYVYDKLWCVFSPP